MPELPEVETIVRKLRPDLVGKTITNAKLLWPRTLASPSPKLFKRQIRGQKIEKVSRRAKYLDIKLSDFHLFIHLRMSGDLYIKENKAPLEKHDRLILEFGSIHTTEKKDGSKLVFNDTRKFGRVWLVRDANDVIGGLGPEPLSKTYTAEKLYADLQSRHRQLKPLLLDQSFLAGMGNIYTDEALHIARLHPLTSSDSVNRKHAKLLFDAIQEVLQEGIRRNGASIDWVYRGGEFQNYFRVYGRDGKPCPNCGTVIIRLVVGQRATHICPNCQVKGS
ncbi:MAG: DNA-formamidopyrimidine glycosylase [Anaerolineae bacterium]|nr:DNA-formamidopyrimidine glycosylase [Anaerolineae bacterium]MDK1080795.1 DNA-formamidopyrimidine glycosylase [Anaerolineae bacterium]